MKDEDVIVLFEAPKIVQPEFRLYYGEQGEVLYYTCDKPEGNFIVIDRMAFAEMRFDIRVIDGKISRVAPNAVVHKLMPTDDETEIAKCHPYDMSIIVDTDYSGDVQNWKLTSYELK
jgi:hypothetical protein